MGLTKITKHIIAKIKRNIAKIKYPMEEYIPAKKTTPANMLHGQSAWTGLELVVEDILDRFAVGRNKCIEFGVEYGYSSVIFSNFFKEVKGIDIFIGDEHSGFKNDHYEKTKRTVSAFKNIELIQSDYRDWIKNDTEIYDFAHVDIVHSYNETYECGLWAVKHSKCCVFHDTEHYPEVRKAVFDIAKATGKKLYNYPYHFGLGIIV